MVRLELGRNGYDGVIYKNEVEGGTSYIAFNAHQIKSAIGNNGEFSPFTPLLNDAWVHQRPKMKI